MYSQVDEYGDGDVSVKIVHIFTFRMNMIMYPDGKK